MARSDPSERTSLLRAPTQHDHKDDPIDSNRSEQSDEALPFADEQMLQPNYPSDNKGSPSSSLAEDEKPMLSTADAPHLQTSRPLFSIVFFLLGLAAASPYKAFTSAVDYFAYKFPSFHVLFLISLAYSLPSVPALFYMVKSGHKIPYDIRVYGSLIVGFLTVGAVPLIDYTRPKNCPIALSSVLFCVFCSGVSAGVLYPSIFGLASSFPRTATVYMMTGLGLAGLSIILMRIVTKFSLAEGPDSTRISSYVYFAIAALSVAVAIVAYWILRRSPQAAPYLTDLHKKKTAQSQAKQDEPRTSYASIHSRVWVPGLALFLNMIITACCFPGLVAEIQSTNPALNRSKWFQIFCVTSFVCGDSGGRFSPYFIKNMARHFPSVRLMSLVLCRSVFLALFWICIHPRVIASDPVVYLIVLIFSFTNGIAISASSSVAPTLVETAAERRLTGTFMSLCLNGGIFAGSMLAIYLLWQISGQVPW